MTPDQRRYMPAHYPQEIIARSEVKTEKKKIILSHHPGALEQLVCPDLDCFHKMLIGGRGHTWD